MLRITIAGASGFVGSNLIKLIQDTYQVKALSRSEKEYPHENVKFVKADLFSLTSTLQALKDTDIAIYLVHSMMPSSRLFQGDFHDTDLILADNFTHACKENNVKQIIYLGGIVPKGHISEHLESRLEVEKVLEYSKIPCTILRAGMVVGNGGSSFNILTNLVDTLPAMILPKWTDTKTQIVYLDDLLEIINYSIGNTSLHNKTLNVVNGEVIKYRDLIEQTKKHLNKRALLIPVPINYTAFSKLWVTLFGRSDYELVSPLIDSLLCDFSETTPSKEIQHLIKYPTYASMLPKIEIKKSPRKKSLKKCADNNVRSIQRLMSDNKINTEDVVKSYMSWLPSHMKPFIKVREFEERIVNFYFIGIRAPLLTLQYIPSLQDKDRVKMHIIGGLLTETTNTGWLEFRNIEGGKYLLASINEFHPSLPWYVYKYSQASIHKYAMLKFGKFLEQAAGSKDE